MHECKGWIEGMKNGKGHLFLCALDFFSEQSRQNFFPAVLSANKTLRSQKGVGVPNLVSGKEMKMVDIDIAINIFSGRKRGITGFNPGQTILRSEMLKDHVNPISKRSFNHAHSVLIHSIYIFFEGGLLGDSECSCVVYLHVFEYMSFHRGTFIFKPLLEHFCSSTANLFFRFAN